MGPRPIIGLPSQYLTNSGFQNYPITRCLHAPHTSKPRIDQRRLLLSWSISKVSISLDLKYSVGSPMKSGDNLAPFIYLSRWTLILLSRYICWKLEPGPWQRAFKSALWFWGMSSDHVDCWCEAANYGSQDLRTECKGPVIPVLHLSTAV